MKKDRIQSIDLLRGIVMVIMALDHVRDYFNLDAFYFSPTDLDQTTPFLFFTRFITHYCAPVFVFLSGTSAYFVSLRKTKNELSKFLFTRGLWLVLVECTLVMTAWSFNPMRQLIGLQVIWAIAISMIALAALVHLNWKWVLAIGLILVSGHNLLDNIHYDNAVWYLLHERGAFTVGEWKIVAVYPVIPWIGLMAIGYCAGRLYSKTVDSTYRKKILNAIGLSALVLFAVLRFSNLYGDMVLWSVQQNPVFTFLSFLKVTKYPPSLLYALVTIGPALLFLANGEKIKGWFSDILIVFGRVPFFYYIIHLYLIHFFAMIAAELQGYGWQNMILTGQVNTNEALKGYGYTIGATYMIWIALVLMLYPMCRWYNNYKTNHPEKWWLSYL